MTVVKQVAFSCVNPRGGRAISIIILEWKVLHVENIWIWVRRGVLIFGVLLSFFAVIECIRAYQTLHNLHFVAGYLFLGVLCVGGSWLIWWLVMTIWFRPVVLVGPPIRDAKTPSSHGALTLWQVSNTIYGKTAT